MVGYFLIVSIENPIVDAVRMSALMSPRGSNWQILLRGCIHNVPGT